MIRTAAILALVALSACGARQSAGPDAGSANLSNEDRLAMIIEAKGCQLGPVRAAEARSELGLDDASFDAVLQSLKDQGRVTVQDGGQIELMSEVCI